MIYPKLSVVAFVAASLFRTVQCNPANLKAPGLSSIACSLGHGDAHFEANQDSYSNLARFIPSIDPAYVVEDGSDQSCWSVTTREIPASLCLRAPEGYSVESIGVSTIVTGIYFSCRGGGDTNVDTNNYACPYDGQHLVGVGYMDGGSIFLCMP